MGEESKNRKKVRKPKRRWANDTEQLAALWVARLISRVSPEFAKHYGADTVIRNSTSLLLIDTTEAGFDPSAFLSKAKKRLQELETLPNERSGPVFENLGVFSKTIGLTETESDVVLVGMLTTLIPTLYGALDSLYKCTNLRTFDCLAAIIGRRENDIQEALHPSGVLHAGGIINAETYSCAGLEPYVLSIKMRLLLQKPSLTREDIFQAFARKSEKDTLNLKSFPQVEKNVRLLVRYLKRSSKIRVKGVNIFIHGKSGTGKTELARALADHIGSELFKVACEEKDGDPSPDFARLKNYQLVQKILRRSRNTMVLFDDVEDIFPVKFFNLFLNGSTSGHDKAFMNRLLENNAVPAIWISNEIGQIDKAFLRRFDYVLHLRTPPRAIRQQILQKKLGSLPVSEDWVSRISKNPQLTPAEISRAVKVVSCIRTKGTAETEKSLEHVLAAGSDRDLIQIEDEHWKGVLPYDPQIVRTNVPLGDLINGLRSTRHATILLHGQPGTGKSRCAQYIADELELPLSIRTGSDLLAPWVGQTEVNIAEMFAAAREEQGVLFLDEVDSLLRTRAQADKSWEVTQVNELLVQMERFKGIFLCATNRLEALDPASLRRFSIKLRLEAPGPDARWELFRNTLKLLGIKIPSGSTRKSARAELDRLENLTPGEFAAVIQRVKVLNHLKDHKSVLNELGQELMVRNCVQKTQIGFSI